jgi:hypothetical protein
MANPLYQQLPPTTRPWEVGPIAGSPFPASTFPAGSFIGGGGTTINTGTLAIVRTMGVKLNG